MSEDINSYELCVDVIKSIVSRHAMLYYRVHTTSVDDA